MLPLYSEEIITIQNSLLPWALTSWPCSKCAAWASPMSQALLWDWQKTRDGSSVCGSGCSTVSKLGKSPSTISHIFLIASDCSSIWLSTQFFQPKVLNTFFLSPQLPYEDNIIFFCEDNILRGKKRGSIMLSINAQSPDQKKNYHQKWQHHHISLSSSLLHLSWINDSNGWHQNILSLNAWCPHYP